MRGFGVFLWQQYTLNLAPVCVRQPDPMRGASHSKSAATN